jgi:hypothetical protein
MLVQIGIKINFIVFRKLDASPVSHNDTIHVQPCRDCPQETVGAATNPLHQGRNTFSNNGREAIDLSCS